MMRIPGPHDPFRPPDWRHRRCVYFLEARRCPLWNRDDPATWAGWHFLRSLRRCRCEKGRARLARRHPALAAAHRVRSAGGLTRWGLEAYLLAGVDPPEVDARFVLPAGGALAYAEQFYDVLGRLEARDYLVNVVIGLHSHRALSEKDADVFVPLLGLMGGRHVADAVLAFYETAPPALPADLGGLGQEDRLKLRTWVRVRAAILARCLPEESAEMRRWQTLLTLAERSAGRDPPAGVRSVYNGGLLRSV
jgi:hypothetical protein